MQAQVALKDGEEEEGLKVFEVFAFADFWLVP
jgi:hypothetical protein